MSRTEAEARGAAIKALVSVFRPNAAPDFVEFISDCFAKLPTRELRQAIAEVITREEQAFNPIAVVTNKAEALVRERERIERAEEMNRRHREQKRIGDDVPLDTSWRGKAQSISDLARSLAGEMTVDSPDAADGREER